MTYAKTYLIGGHPPYGYSLTPAYQPFQVPSAADMGITETALYERLDWIGGVGDATSPNQQYQNPPFIGVGNTLGGGRVPSWMDTGDPNNPKRILRGYLRRYGSIVTLGTATSERQRATNARLYFMYNPGTIQRSYQSTVSAMSSINPTNDPAGPDQANIPPVSQTTVQFELFFDRGEEVARFQNHPGTLVDLAVFDLLARGGSPGQTTADQIKAADESKNPANYTADTSGGSAVTVSADDANQTVDSTSLAFDPSLPIVAIFSPNIAFYGNIIAADAFFEKFSHRMTPTRMRLVITLRINSIGQEQRAQYVDGGVLAAASSQAAIAALNPEVGAGTDAHRDELNASGRASAMHWAEQWLPGKATTNGILYSLPLRCANQENDNYLDTSPPHVPGGFDCSSYVARSYLVIGWGPALFIGCTDTNGFEKAASEHTDVWATFNIKDHKAFVGDVYKQFNDWTKVGDCILRSGSMEAGHIGFVHGDLGGDGGDHKWEILHSYSGGKPPAYLTYTTDQIVNGTGLDHGPYTKVIRAKPIKTNTGKDVVVVPKAPGT